MFRTILTLTVCLTIPHADQIFEEISSTPNYENEPLYNIHDWIEQLQLERCALVAVGLKYFAIFVEDISENNNETINSTKYFLGLCQQSTLEEWVFCSPSLRKKRSHKCKFKLKNTEYHGRVHRRFCDIRIMVNNKDCQCEPTIFGDVMFKVRGFPTCYISPLPDTLCKYNVCGLSRCETATVENRVHTVRCEASCKGGNPFCEHPIDKSARVPAVRSFWTDWRTDQTGKSTNSTGKNRSLATCINKYNNKGDVSCLGPGTGCCSSKEKNCTCITYEEKGILKLEKTMFVQHIEEQTSSPAASTGRFPLAQRFRRKLRRKPRNITRYIRDTDEDIEDDEDEDDLDEDIVLEENTDEVVPISTTEDLDKEQAAKQLKDEMMEELVAAEKNNTADIDPTKKNKSVLYRNNYGSTIMIIICVLWPLFLKNKVM